MIIFTLAKLRNVIWRVKVRIVDNVQSKKTSPTHIWSSQKKRRHCSLNQKIVDNLEWLKKSTYYPTPINSQWSLLYYKSQYLGQMASVSEGVWVFSVKLYCKCVQYLEKGDWKYSFLADFETKNYLTTSQFWFTISQTKLKKLFTSKAMRSDRTKPIFRSKPCQKNRTEPTSKFWLWE